MAALKADGCRSKVSTQFISDAATMDLGNLAAKTPSGVIFDLTTLFQLGLRRQIASAAGRPFGAFGQRQGPPHAGSVLV